MEPTVDYETIKWAILIFLSAVLTLIGIELTKENETSDPPEEYQEQLKKWRGE